MECVDFHYQLSQVSHQWALDLYELAKKNFWVPNQYTLTQDKEAFTRISPDAKHYLTYTLAFFSSAEGWVGQNILTLSQQTPNTELRMFLGFQLMEEMKHIDTFRYIMDGLGIDSHEIYELHKTTPAIQTKRDFEVARTQSLCRTPNIANYIEDVFVYYAILEGIFFFSGFIIPITIGDYYGMPNVAALVRWILKDETRHLAFGIQLLQSYNAMLKGYEARFSSLMEEAVEIECDYAKVVMPHKIIGLSYDQYTAYVRYLADRRMRALGFSPIYGQKNPMKSMISKTDLPDLTNFFEATPEY